MYDGDGNRIEKSSLPAVAGGTLYWYGLNSAPLEETNLTGGMLRDYIFFGGERISVYTPTSTVLGFFDDHLGSTSKLEEVSSSGTVSQGFDSDYYPFGRAHQFVDSYDPAFKFMGKERDAETGLDNFGARYNDSTIGRFISAAKRAPRSPVRGAWEIGRAVPAPVPYANLTNPQTLNLYALVRDNPETFADLDGHQDGGAPSCAQALPGSHNCTKTATSPAATTGGNDPGSNKTGAGTPTSPTQQAQQPNVADQQLVQLQQQQHQQALNAINGPAAGSQDYLKATLGEAGKQAETGIKGGAEGMAIADTLVAGTVAVGATGAATTAVNALKIGAQAVSDTVGTVSEVATNVALKVGVAAETTIPGGVAAASQFVQAAVRPLSAAPTTAGMLGLLANATYKAISQYF